MPVFLKPKYRVLYLMSDTDVNLASWIASQGVSSGKVQVIIPAGEVIGGTVDDAYAINVGNIAPYDDVILDVLGELQGRGGTASQKNGGGGVYSAHPITINIGAAGGIRAGGGAGGAGGLGGYGDSYSNQEGPYHGSSPKYQYVIVSDGCCRCFWNNTQVADNRTNIYNAYNGGYWYWAGANTSGGFYYIYRGLARTGVKGTGGSAGEGQGYGQTSSAGTAGSNGTYNAGNGGDGGDGGAWGADGQSGVNGSTGYYINSQSKTNASAGSAGGSGGTGGYAIYAYNGAATGVVVNNLGVIAGQTYY